MIYWYIPLLQPQSRILKLSIIRFILYTEMNVYDAGLIKCLACRHKANKWETVINANVQFV